MLLVLSGVNAHLQVRLVKRVRSHPRRRRVRDDHLHHGVEGSLKRKGQILRIFLDHLAELFNAFEGCDARLGVHLDEAGGA